MQNRQQRKKKILDKKNNQEIYYIMIIDENNKLIEMDMLTNKEKQEVLTLLDRIKARHNHLDRIKRTGGKN